MFSPGICRWLFLLVSLATWVALTNSKEMRVVCYYTNWSVYRPGDAKFSPQNINPYLCTHLIYAFGGFTKENTLKPFDKYQDIEKGGYAKFTGLKTYNKNLKTMLAIGGWNEGSARFSSMVASLERRKEFAKNAIKFLRLNHFDGLDLDWEYPSFRDGGKPRDRDNYPLLIQDLREEFDREAEKTGRSRLLLTVAVPAGIEYINKGFDVPKITRYVDWMNILSYDYHSAFEPSVNHHAPLYSLEEESEYNYDSDLNVHHSIKHYLKNGADPNKLVLGIPTYGRSYTLLNPEAFEIGSPADGPGSMGEATRENGYLAYYEICEYVKNDDWEVEQPNSKVMGPYAFKDNQWVGYDDEEIVKRKAEYVAENNLGGIMFWSIDNDDFRGKCHDKPYPLIEAGRAALLAAYGATDDNLVSPTRKPVKSRTRTRTKTLNKVESSDDEKIEKSDKLQTRRRNRIKPSKSKEVNEEETTTKRKTRRKELSNEETSSYSSLKVVTPSYTTPAPPATPDVDGEFKCEEDGFYPHPKDCKKYYWCLSGPGDSGIVAHQFTCPAGLYFNKAADSCDYTQNVLCNKKMQKVTAAVTDTSYPSTSRAPPKITAATSRTTFVQTTTTTTEAYEEDDEEYEDEEIESVKEESEEDPRVIKELIELIKKAGGLEELEKQLKAKEDVPNSPEQSTTKSTLSKTLYERVLSKAIKNNPTTISPSRNTKSRNSVFRNSRGPQSEKTEDDEEKENQKKTDRGKLEYTSVSRFRPSVSRDKKIEEEKEDQEIEQNSDSLSTKKVTDKFPTYTNIRRARVSTTTIKTPINDRNTILGEIPAEDEEEDDDDEETNDDDDDTEFNKKVALTTKKPNLPQYVNIRRQRPSTTEEVSTALYTEITRGTPAESSSSEGGSSTTSKYKQIRRGTTTVSTKKPNVEEAQTLSTKLYKEETSTPQSSSTESVLGRSSTTENPSNETIEDNRNEYLYNITTTRTYLTTDDIMNNEKPNTPSKPNLFKTIQRKRPQLFEPRPFSKPTEASTTAATQTTKVSYEKPTINFRSRGASRFNPQKTSNTTESEVKENTSKRRLIVTEKYIEDHRSYRPSELADLSSLTAVDFDNIKELHAQTGQRRRRPLKPSSTTSTTTQSSLLPYKRRRVNVNLNELSKNPQTTDRNTVIDSLQSTSRNRKIIRRYRPTTTSSTEAVKSLLDNNEVDDDSFEDTSTEEYENIKLSESNIRENSDINSFQVDPKLKNKFIKTSNLFGKSSVYGEEKSSTVNIVPSTTSTEATSTKKIIPAEPSKITYVDSEKVFGRKRKIIRKFRPHQNTTTATNVENNTPTINLKEILSEPTPEKDTPSSNLQNKIVPKRIFRPRDGNRRFTPVTVEPEYSPINKTGLLRGTNKAFRQTTTTTESSASSQRFSFIPRRTTKQFKSSSTTEATSQIPTTVSEEDVDTTTIKPNTFETTTESSASSQRFSIVPRRSTKQFALSSTTEATSQHIPITVSEEDVDTTTIKPNTFESTTESSASSQRFSFVPTRSTKQFTSSSTTEATSQHIPITVSEEDVDTTTIKPNTFESTTESSASSQRFSFVPRRSTKQFTSSSTTEATSQHIPTTVSEEDVDITTITSNTFEPTTEQIITETILNESTSITTKENDIISKYTDIPDTAENLETTTVKLEEFSTENFEQTTDTPTDTTLSIETTTASQNSTTASLKQTSLEYKSNILRPAQSRPKFIPSKLKNLSNNENTETGGFKPRNNYRNRLQSSTSTSTTESTRFFAKSTRRYNKFRPGIRFEKSNNIDSLENSSTLDGNVKVDEDDENIEVKTEESYSVDTVDEIKKAKNKFLPNSFRPTSRPYSKNIFSKAVTEESKIIDDVKDVNTDAVKTKNRNLFKNRKPYAKESEEDGVEDDNDEQKEDEDKISDEEVAVKDEIKTSKRKYLPNISTSTLRPSNKPYYFSKTATEEPKTTEELKDVDTEAVKTRNKNLFNNRNNNLNHSTSPSSLATEETTAPPTTILTEEPSTYIEEEVTTSQPTESTTLIHIFAEKEETNQTTSNKVERIIEVNRIVNVKSKEDVTDEESTVVDKIGAVNRVTVIKVVDKDGKLVDSNETVSQTTESPIKSSVDMIIQIAKIEEIPGKTMEKINLTSVSVDVNKPATNREDRKLDLQGSKVDFSKNDLNGKAEIFGGLSHINIITPRTVRLTESSTIALEGLFQTEKPNLFTGKNSINDELLETENSKFVNVRVLHPDEGYRINKKLLDQPKIIPIKILKQDDDYVMKAKVVEVSTQSQFNTFKIVPIQVEAAKRLPPPLPLIRINRQYN